MTVIDNYYNCKISPRNSIGVSKTKHCAKMSPCYILFKSMMHFKIKLDSGKEIKMSK